MWRAAILRQVTSGPRPLLRRLPTTTSSGTPINIHIHITRAFSSHQDEPPIIPNSSIPKSMEDAQTLEEVMESVQEQMIEDERRRELENPTPWFSLLHYPSRAAWRSSDHMLGISSNDESKDAAVTPLSQTQFNLIQHSERTNKQLKRTYKRVMETHKTNAIKRERERRMAANISNPKQQGSATDDGGDGAIKDTKGKMVGNWRDKNKKKKKLSPTNTLCDDPSVALALSIGLSHSKRLHTTDGTADDLAVLESFGVKGIKSASKLAKSRDMSSGKSSKEQSVGYGPEQCLTHIKYRLGPNYVSEIDGLSACMMNSIFPPFIQEYNISSVAVYSQHIVVHCQTRIVGSPKFVGRETSRGIQTQIIPTQTCIRLWIWRRILLCCGIGCVWYSQK